MLLLLFIHLVDEDQGSDIGKMMRMSAYITDMSNTCRKIPSPLQTFTKQTCEIVNLLALSFFQA